MCVRVRVPVEKLRPVACRCGNGCDRESRKCERQLTLAKLLCDEVGLLPGSVLLHCAEGDPEDCRPCVHLDKQVVFVFLVEDPEKLLQGEKLLTNPGRQSDMIETHFSGYSPA